MEYNLGDTEIGVICVWFLFICNVQHTIVLEYFSRWLNYTHVFIVFQSLVELYTRFYCI